MGQCAGKMCGENFFKMLMEKYGDDVAKFISIEKAKIFIQEKYDELKGQLTEKIASFKTQLFDSIDNIEKQLDELVEKIKKNLDDIIPGGIDSLQKLKGQSFQDILGYNQFKEKFKELRQQGETKITEKEEFLWKEVEQKKVQGIKKLQSQQPRLPLYDDLPEKQQRMIFKQGEKRFEKEIEEQKENTLKEIQGNLSPQAYMEKIQQLFPSGSVNSLLDGAKQKFERIQKSLGEGGLSGLADRFF